MTEERTLRRYDRCDTLQDAFAYIMNCLDEIPVPKISINPVWLSKDGFHVPVFDTTVEGTPTVGTEVTE
jgi:hypothetical protein